jgi:hypothetical protein
MNAGTITLLKRAITKEKNFIEVVAKDTNPQIIEMRHKAQGRLDAFEAALDSLRGTHCFLRIYAREDLA